MNPTTAYGELIDMIIENSEAGNVMQHILADTQINALETAAGSMALLENVKLAHSKGYTPVRIINEVLGDFLGIGEKS